MHKRKQIVMLVVTATATAAVLLVGTGSAAPTQFQLTFNGMHRPATFPTPLGLQHEGPFTASAPFCSSGYAVDVQHDARALAASRKFTCDGGGSITLLIADFPGEHDLGYSAAWKIIAGTGQYTTLRGQGTWTSVSVNGDQNNPSTLTFRTVLKGVVDFDSTAPTVAISKASVRRFGGRGRRYSLNLAFSARDDNAANPVAYGVTVGTDLGQHLATRSGSTTSGAVALSLRIKPSKTTRRIKIQIIATDPLGNARTLTRWAPIRR
jgi:hypothetical protein